MAKLLTDSNEYENERDYASCIDSAQSVLKLEPQVANVRFIAHQHLCKCYTGNSEPSQAIKNCHEALKIRKEAAVYCDRAEAYLAAEMFDDGKCYLYKASLYNFDTRLSRKLYLSFIDLNIELLSLSTADLLIRLSILARRLV